MADAKERLAQEGFSDDEVDAILERAADLQHQAEQERQELSQEALKVGAEAVGIREEFVEQAVRELKAERERKASRRRTLIIIGVVAAALFALISLFSHYALSERLTEVEAKRAQLENVLQRRHDLISNLIALTKASAAHEKELVASINTLMQKLGQGQAFEERQSMEHQLSEAVRKLMVSLRADPKISSTALFIRLSDEMAGAENRIAVERKRYNEAVAAYNQVARNFPVFLARPFLGFPKNIRPFQAAPEAHKPPRF